MIHTQAGKAVKKLQGTLPGYGKAWYWCPDGIANILSLAHVAKTRLVTFNSTNGNQLEVTKNDGSTRIFQQSQHGLYYYDMKQWKSKPGQSHGLPAGYGSTILLNTVAENKAKYTLSDYKHAELARTIQRRICQPNIERYMVH
jgi:hypothetical protein